MMPALPRLLYTLLLYASLAVAFTNAASFRMRSWRGASAAVEHVGSTVDGRQDETAFSRLLSAVSPQALHQLLHEYIPETVKDGVFGNSDRKAADTGRSGNAGLGPKVVHLAVRQASSVNNDTTSSDAQPSSTSSSSSSSSSSDTPPPPTTTTTTTKTSTEAPTSSSTQQTPTESTSSSQDTSPSSPPPSSSTPTTTTTTTTTPVPTSTPQIPGMTGTTPSSPPPSSSSSSSPISESSSNVESSSTSTFSTSTTSTPTSKTSTFTSTLPGGAVTTVTEVAIVTPEASEGSEGTPTSAVGNLQTGAAAPIVKGRGFEIAAGLLVGGFILA